MFHLRIPAITQVTDLVATGSCKPRLCKLQEVAYTDLAWPAVVAPEPPAEGGDD